MTHKWSTQGKCAKCGVERVVRHNTMKFPEYCPFCGTNANGNHSLELVTDEVEALRELIDDHGGTQSTLARIRWKIGIIREEPRDPDVDARFS